MSDVDLSASTGHYKALLWEESVKEWVEREGMGIQVEVQVRDWRLFPLSVSLCI